MVPLNVEQRKKILELRSSSNSRKTTDMSASPKLKPRKKPKQALKMKRDVLNLVKMTPGEEFIPSKNFGETKPAPKAGPKPKLIGNKDNNNTVSFQLPYTTELGSTPTNPEMAL